MDILVFASNNKHKLQEVKAIVGDLYKIISLEEAGINVEIPEPHDTIEANATEKSRTIFALTGKNCFSDDTGLEINALNGEPGVRSARYAGPDNNFEENVEKVLQNLKGKDDRRAKFRTVVSLILAGNEYLFEGICNGQILEAPRGLAGFGYDPIFVPDGSTKTFAEMDIQEKNIFSHRQKAMLKLLTFLSHHRKTASP